MQKKITLLLVISLLLSMVAPISLVTSQEQSDNNTGENGNIFYDYLDKNEHELILNLSEGWNYISFNVEPENMSMLSIVQPLIDEGSFLIMIDGEGGVLYPQNGTDTIGDMQVTKGYELQVNQSTSLSVNGTLAELPQTIELNQGMNLIGYPVYEPRDGLEVVNPLIDEGSLIAVIDQHDAMIYYNQTEWINEIGYFQPGQGYYINVSSNTSLEIPLPEDPTVPQFSGPDIAYLGEEVEFQIGGSEYQGFGDILYYIDWGDGTDQWIGPLPSGENTTVVHVWETLDEYTISLFAEVPTGQQSQIVNFSIMIEKADPPIPVISGPTNAGPFILLNYSAVSEDPYADSLYYQWDFGDGNVTEWMGPYEPGIPIVINYSWFEEGIYPIRVNAKDNYDQESGWSEPYNISIASQISITNLEIGFIYLNIFAEENPYGYIIFLDMIGAIVMVSRDPDLLMQTNTSEHVHSVLFNASDLISFENYSFLNENISNGFEASLPLYTGIWQLSVSAYNSEGVLIDIDQIDFFLYIHLVRQSRAMNIVNNIRARLLNPT
ncbi:MAG: hypothetical protein R6V50_07205 [Thermoplasmatota archaeon]